MPERRYNVLFLCTGNSARSIMAEAILRKEAPSRFATFSAGSRPKGEVHPLALETLKEMECPIEGLRSKTWEEFARPDAPKMDFVFTVCDAAAGEACPLWPGRPVTAHWGIEDPAAAAGTPLERQAAFVRAAAYLKNRILVFANLPLSSLDSMALASRLGDIGRMDGATR